jgi:ABC-type Fe3+ transport system permease subunit
VRRRARLAALRAAYLAAAIPGTVLGVSGLMLWAIASALEDAAQPDLGG